VDRRSAGIEGGGIVEGRRRRIAVAGAAVAALGLAAGGATYAATNGGPQEEANALAEALNENEGTSLTGQDIQDALKDVLKERLDAAVKGGKITQEEADRILERASERGFPLGPGPGGPDFHIEFRGGPFVAAAAKALGLSEDALRQQLEDGKSLADVAEAEGKSVAGLKTALLGAAREALDDAVEAGKLTDAQRDDVLERFEERLDDLVERTGFGPPRLHRSAGFAPEPDTPM
jgi:3-hydroxyacyl-CoA dehydrogenase